MMLNWAADVLQIKAQFAEVARKPFLRQDEYGVDSVQARQFSGGEI